MSPSTTFGFHYCDNFFSWIAASNHIACPVTFSTVLRRYDGNDFLGRVAAGHHVPLQGIVGRSLPRRVDAAKPRNANTRNERPRDRNDRNQIIVDHVALEFARLKLKGIVAYCRSQSKYRTSDGWLRFALVET